MYYKLSKRIRKLSRYTRQHLQRIWQTGEPVKDVRLKAQLFTLFREWQRTMLENAPTLNEIKRYGEELRVNVNAAIFAEVSRIHFVLHYEQLNKEQSTLLDRKFGPLEEDHRAMTTLFSMASTKASFWTSIPLGDTLKWETPIMKYSQQEVVTLVMTLCDILNDLGSIASNDITLPYEDSAQDYLELVTALMTRNAVFLSQKAFPGDTLNVEDMRQEVREGYYSVNTDYLVWCSIYFGQLLRRIYYWENLRENLMEQKPPVTKRHIERCKKFVAKVANQMSEDAYEDCYLGTCEESYDVPGDEEWFAYRFPSKQSARGNILYDLRPDLNKRYWKAAHVTVSTILNSSLMDQPRYYGHTSYLFVLNVMNSYFKTRNIAWRNACVVDNGGIEMSSWKLSRPQCPIILQVFSRYWVYNDAEYYPTDNIYETLAMWFVLLRDEYDSCLFGTDMTDIIKQILG